MWVRWTISTFLLFGTGLVLSATAQTEPAKVWQIGKFDKSPLEFSPDPHGSVRFEVGKSDPKHDWPVNQTTGHPYSIVFPLRSLAGVYALKVSVLIVQPRVPVLSVDINGHVGRFYLQPQLS